MDVVTQICEAMPLRGETSGYDVLTLEVTFLTCGAFMSQNIHTRSSWFGLCSPSEVLVSSAQSWSLLKISLLPEEQQPDFMERNKRQVN